MENKTKGEVLLIILLAIILYCSSALGYLISMDEYLNKNFYWLALSDLLICTFVMIIVPFVWRLINGKKFDIQKGKKICKWNSIIMFIISLSMQSSYNLGFIGGLGALFYYFINMCLFVDIDNSEKEIEDTTFECNNCGEKVLSDDKECPHCGVIFVEEDTDDITEEDIDEISKEEPEEKFKCDNCGALVKESDIKCPNCGESFEDEKNEEKEIKTNIDQKFSDLNKLKKLLDDKIITKAEFDKEKKKILND